MCVCVCSSYIWVNIFDKPRYTRIKNYVNSVYTAQQIHDIFKRPGSQSNWQANCRLLKVPKPYYVFLDVVYGRWWGKFAKIDELPGKMYNGKKPFDATEAKDLRSLWTIKDLESMKRDYTRMYIESEAFHVRQQIFVSLSLLLSLSLYVYVSLSLSLSLSLSHINQLD